MSALPKTPSITVPRIEARIQTVQAAMQAAGLKPLQTADENDDERLLARAKVRYEDWVKAIYRLSEERAEEWDAHAQMLKYLPGIDRPVQLVLFREMKRIGLCFDVAYNRDERRFYVREISSVDSFKFL